MNQPKQFTRDDLEKIVIANINEYGWHCVNVIEDDGHPPWSYTIGLYDTWEHPELIIVGILRLAAPFTPRRFGVVPRSGPANTSCVGVRRHAAHPCVRPAPASQACEPDSPPGLRPLALPCAKASP
jgi:Domain of unknown function (DUF4262)